MCVLLRYYNFRNQHPRAKFSENKGGGGRLRHMVFHSRNFGTQHEMQLSPKKVFTVCPTAAAANGTTRVVRARAHTGNGSVVAARTHRCLIYLCARYVVRVRNTTFVKPKVRLPLCICECVVEYILLKIPPTFS